MTDGEEEPGPPVGRPSTRVPCWVCDYTVAVSTVGTLRRHPRGAAEPCPGSGTPANAPHAPTPGLTTAAPGDHASAEPMLAADAAPPAGYVVLQLVAHVPTPENPATEAALLYEDPARLYAVLDATPNDRVRLTLTATAPPARPLPQEQP